jgi:hypothetical protein
MQQQLSSGVGIDAYGLIFVLAGVQFCRGRHGATIMDFAAVDRRLYECAAGCHRSIFLQRRS